jgi:Na+:H+ antiporter, NhaA family
VTNPAPGNGKKTILSRGSYPEYVRLSDLMRKETVGGIMLLIAAVAALIWASQLSRRGQLFRHP